MDIDYYDKKAINIHIRDLKAQLKTMEPKVLKKADIIRGERKGVLSFHAEIGSNNNILVDCIRSRFPTYLDFIAKWMKGLLDKVKQVEEEKIAKYGRVYKDTPWHRLLKYVKDPVIIKYIFVYFERNFYTHLKERTRHKPNENQWEIWFGEKITWGLLIAPAFRNSSWTNDKSEMRRANYNYWTIGHVLETGLINPDSNTPITWSTADLFLNFYINVIKRCSISIYEKGIVDRYIAYLKDSTDIASEPLLIPEFRYAGIERKHEHRLDFTIFNSHVRENETTGFELSPSSTHMKLTGKDGNTLKDLNKNIAEKWSKEMKKRNKYFLEYNISTVTFTDDHLTNLDDCFAIMRVYLEKRSDNHISLNDVIEEINNF